MGNLSIVLRTSINPSFKTTYLTKKMKATHGKFA